MCEGHMRCWLFDWPQADHVQSKTPDPARETATGQEVPQEARMHVSNLKQERVMAGLSSDLDKKLDGLQLGSSPVKVDWSALTDAVYLTACEHLVPTRRKKQGLAHRKLSLWWNRIPPQWKAPLFIESLWMSPHKPERKQPSPPSTWKSRPSYTRCRMTSSAT